MATPLTEIRDGLKAVVRGFEPDLLTGAAAKQVVILFAEIERLGAAGKLLAARRVDEAGAGTRDGDRSTAHWLSRTTGTSVSDATGALRATEAASDAPAVDAAMRDGRLSPEQLKAIAPAAAAAPEAAADLVAAAAHKDLIALREQAARARAAHEDAAERERSIRARRSLHAWDDVDGSACLTWRGSATGRATVLAALKPFQDAAFARARCERRHEADRAYAADALVDLAQASLDGALGATRSAGSEDAQGGRARGGAVKPARTGVQVRVDLEALARGHVEPGERCEVVGSGPISVAAAWALARDAIIEALLTDGDEVIKIHRFDRHVPAALRRALEWRDPTCAVPFCSATVGLQRDHRVPVAEQGPTSYDNLVRLCPFHHGLKTHRGFRLVGPVGRRSWIHPDGTVISTDPPPPGGDRPPELFDDAEP